MKKQEKTSPLEMISDWFSQYTLDYPNRDPDKISFYAVGWISIALLGMCVMFADIAAGVLLIVFFGLILTGIMLWKNPEVFNIKKKQNIPWMMSAYSLLYLSSVTFACFHWHDGQQRSLAMCIISAMLISLLLFYILYRWQRKASMEDSIKQIQEKQEQFEKTTGNSLEQLHAKTDRSYSSLLDLHTQLGETAEELKKKIQPDTRHAEFNKWGTVPNCLKKVLKILVEDGYRTQKQVDSLSFDTIRINIQKRLRDKNAEKKRDKHADFYKIVDIAEEVSNEFPELQKTMLLAELDRIASPENDLQLHKK